MFKKFFASMLFVALAASALAAVTNPAVTLSDGTNSVTVDSTGTTTVNAGTATVSTVIFANSGGVALSGIQLGNPANITITTVVCVIAPATHLDCLLTNAHAYVGSTLTITFNGPTNNGPGNFTSGLVDAGGTITGTAAVTWAGQVNGSTIASVGAFTSSSFNGSAVGTANVPTPTYLSTVITVVMSAGAAVGGDFEYLATLTPPEGGGGCPATPGYWKNQKKHPFPSSLSFPVFIGGVSYSAADFYTVLGGLQNTNGAVGILGFQLVAAVLNIAAGAAHGAQADAAILYANQLLQVGLPGGPAGVTFPINMVTDKVDPNTALGTAMTNTAGTLNSFNSDLLAPNIGCTEGSGLTLGSKN